jgi:uncharacterized phiE125 gp8 family phage protein
MRVERISTPATAAVSSALAAEHSRADLDPSFAAEIDRMTQAAVREIEAHAHVALVRQTIRVTLDGWPGELRQIDLPIAPVLEGATVTVTVGGFAFSQVELGTGLRPTLILTAVELTAEERAAEWVIEYEAGFGDAAADVPPDLAHAVMDQVAALFDWRGGGQDKGTWLSPHAARIAARYRRVKL